MWGAPLVVKRVAGNRLAGGSGLLRARCLLGGDLLAEAFQVDHESPVPPPRDRLATVVCFDGEGQAPPVDRLQARA
jgi:hypothetical protein